MFSFFTTTTKTLTTLSLLLTMCSSVLMAQPKSPSIVSRFAPVKLKVPFLPQDKDPQLFGTGSRFIENIGQYGKSLKGSEGLGNINYAFEGFGMPVLLTQKAMIFFAAPGKPIDRRTKRKG